MATTNPFEIELLTVQYTSSVQLLLQQTNTRLRGTVMSGAHVGKMASPVQYIGAVEFKQAGGRGTPVTAQNGQYQRRWISPSDKDLTIQVDTFDELRTIVDPKAPLTAAVQAAGNRLFDDVIINGGGGASAGGFFGTAQFGVDASSLTTETYNSGANFPVSVTVADTFGASAAVSLTVAKLIEGRRILRKYENDIDNMQVHLALSSEEEASLLKQLEFVSKEFRDTAVYEGASMTGFLRCMFHFSERLQISGSDRLLPMWLEDGMYLGLWKDMETIISQRNDLTGHPWQAYTMVSLNSTRLQGGKVVQISVAETSGGDITV